MEKSAGKWPIKAQNLGSGMEIHEILGNSVQNGRRASFLGP